MRTSSVLVTGANGEIGHGLITRLAATGRPIVTIDIAPLEPSLAKLARREFTGSITDTGLLERVLAEFEIDLVFHLAALLSTRSEFTPITAHEVNVGGTLSLLEFAHHEGESHGRPVVFLYPSSIAPRPRRRMEYADDDVRVQQAVLRAPGTLLRAPLQAAGGRHDAGTCRLPLRAVSGSDIGGDGPLGRHVRLRA
jgi:nucleoside-diphosphate-sugar epimerase